MGRANGLTERHLQELPRYRESDAYSEVQRLVLDYAVEMTRTPVDVPDALFEQLRGHFDAAQLVELTAAIAWENYRARYNHAFLLESEGLSEGAFCSVPQRALPPRSEPGPA